MQKEKAKELIELKAKIDTGAGYSSIDKNLARQLGYGDVIDEFDDVSKDILANTTPEERDFIMKDKLEKWGEGFGTVLTRSSHGESYRLVIKMNMILSGIRINTPMTIINRNDLQFPAIIGRKSLRNFLDKRRWKESYL